MIVRTLTGFLLASSALAQNAPLYGFLYDWDRPQIGEGVSQYVRFGAAAEDVLGRIDADDYKDWALGPTGQKRIGGFVTYILDVTDATRESFTIVGYNEDPARPDFPAATQAFRVGPVQMPPTGATPGIVAYRLAAAFTNPANLSGTGDVFFGVGVPAAVLSGGGVTDGLFVGSANNDSTAAPPATFDRTGPRGAFGQGSTVGQGSYVCYNRTSGAGPIYLPANATSLEQLAIDAMVADGTVGGVALAETNQASYLSSGPGLGTSNFLSGMHPDINGLNAGRADNIGFAVTTGTAQVPAGNPVFILMAFGPSPIGSTPLTTIAGGAAGPGTSGNVCIDFTTAASFLATLVSGQPNSFTTVAEAQLNVPLNAGVRSVVASIPGQVDLWWQGFALDLGAAGPGLEIRASGCAVQHLK